MGLRMTKRKERGASEYTSCARKKKKEGCSDGKYSARTSKYPNVICSNHEEERDWILLPRGESIENLPLSRFTALYGKFVPLVSPTVRKQSAYDASIVETFDGNSIETSIQSRPSGPIFPFLSFLLHSSTLSIYPHACWYGMQFRCVIDHLFGSGLTCRELNRNERRGSPFGNKSGGTMTVMVELDGSRLRILLFLPWFHVFESYIEHASCNLWKIEIILKILKLEIRR